MAPAVVGAIIDPGNCLDLAEESSLELVKAAFIGFKCLSETANTPLPKNEPGHMGDADLKLFFNSYKSVFVGA
jgi:hypothetical protein